MRPTVRLRLTAWYASIFLLGGAVLLAISYVIVSRNTTSFPTRVGERLTAARGVVVGVPGVSVQGAPSAEPPEKILAGPDDETFLKLERARKAA